MARAYSSTGLFVQFVPLDAGRRTAMAECKHPEAFVSIINNKRICGLCGAVVPEASGNVLKNVEKATPKKEGKKNARK